jgi:short-subunit dehydrogenase
MPSSPRIIIVTGGASGIGRSVSAELVRRGDTVIVSDVNGDGAKAAAAAMAGPGTAIAATLDVADADAVQALVDSVVAEHGRIDIMFNNAGIGMGGPVEELTIAHWDRVIDINVRGVVNGVVAAYPHMIRRGDGHIVNTASLAGLIPSPGLTPYSMTKHAVVGLSTSLRLEAALYGVRVTAVCPGFTDTAILDAETPADLPPTMMSGRGREIASRVPGGLYDADSLALDILDGIDRNRRLVVAPRVARGMALANRLVPASFEREARRRLVRMREMAGITGAVIASSTR